MSRGWESKSVEDQQVEPIEAQNDATSAQEPVTKPSSNVKSDAERTRARQALELQRERILSERTSSPHRRSALATALASIEEQLAELGWMLHL